MMKYVLVFAIFAIVALAIVGLSSAAWSVSGHVEGTVQIGTIDFGLRNPLVDYSPPGHEVTASVSQDGRVLIVVFEKATKHDTAEVVFTVHNTGTIPLRVSAIAVDAPDEISVTTSGAGTVIPPGDSSSAFRIVARVLSNSHTVVTVRVTPECRPWTD